VEGKEPMKKVIFPLIGLVLFIWTIAIAAEKDFEFQGKTLVFQKPPFTLTLPSEFRLIHSYLHPNPDENSLTRVYFFVKAKEKQVEEMLILQVADKANPQAEPMTVPPLKPYTEKRMYSKSKVKKEGVDIDSFIQLMAWNPDAPSLQPIMKKGIVIPSRWALQSQVQFIYQGEHAVSIRYSKDVHSFGLEISEDGKDWERGSISGNEKRVYEAFHKTFLGMIDSLHMTNH
jgi:hypothetical protein